MREIQSYLILCGVCCIWPAICFMVGWLMRGGKFHVPGLAGARDSVRRKIVTARAMLGSARLGRHE